MTDQMRIELLARLESLSLAPEGPNRFHERGRCLRLLGRWPEAEQELKSALDAKRRL